MFVEGTPLPRAKTYDPLNPAQKRTAHLLGFPGVWENATVQPVVEVTARIGECRFVIYTDGKAELIEGDRERAKKALELLEYEGLKA